MKEPNMMLHTSSWGEKKTFKMIAVDNNCPFAECIFNPDHKVLAIISKIPKQSFHMVPKLNDNGDPTPVVGKPRPKMSPMDEPKGYKEERKLMDTFFEYYIDNPSEIETFVKMFAVNPSYNYQVFMAGPIATPIIAGQPEQPTIEVVSR